MVGVILAGGNGTRLYPITKSTNKHLLPIYEKPMIYYPLTTMLLAGITEIVIVSTDNGILGIKNLLGDGNEFGITIKYQTQNLADGIADAIKVAVEKFEVENEVLVILGDNVFYGPGVGRHIQEIINAERAHIWLQEVDKPQDYGIATLSNDGTKIQSIEEKPTSSESKMAITGLYYFPADLIKQLKFIEKSNRGEYEITSLLEIYLSEGKLEFSLLGRGVFWSDVGTMENFYETSNYVRLIQKRHGLPVGSPHEAALHMSKIDKKQFSATLESMPPSEYRELILKTLTTKSNLIK